MKNKKSKVEVQYLLARIPFIAINSIEKKRVERMFLELSKEMNIPIYFYSMSKGLFEITSGKVLNETKTTTGVLDYIGEQLKIKELKRGGKKFKKANCGKHTLTNEQLRMKRLSFTSTNRCVTAICIY